jgi:Fe-S-cluster-containing hydrogenase component 2
MRLHWPAVALALCAHACAVGGDDAFAPDGPEGPKADEDHPSISFSLETPDDGYNVCEHLPAQPPCSLICDRDALTQYIPESSCAVFVCTLTDGREISVHACHYPDD